MDSKWQSGSSASFPSELFGHKEPHANDVFASIFPPPKGPGSNSAGSGSWHQHSTGSTNREDMDKNRDGGYHSVANRERVEPSYLSSSLYYGGQESYSQPRSSQTSAPYTAFKKDAGEENPTGASRGNWWQGSLYY